MPQLKPLNIIQVSAEMKPYAKTGGLADVAGALPGALAALGHRVATFTPLHRSVSTSAWKLQRVLKAKLTIGHSKFSYQVWKRTVDNGTVVYFIDQPELFRGRHRLYGYPDGNLRYFFFCRAVLDSIVALKLQPDVVHCHDWHAGLIPNLMRNDQYRDQFSDVATVMTIHNIAFQMTGTPWQISPRKRDQGRGQPEENRRAIKRLNFMLRGVMYADAISTVSSRYAEEIQTPEFGNGLDGILHRRRKRLFGILNGIDYEHFDPRHDQYLPVHYHLTDLHKKRRNKSALQQRVGLDVDDNIPIIGMASRITEQKGFELLFEIMDQLLTMHVQLAIVGSGDPAYEAKIRQYQEKYPDKIGTSLEFSEEMASLVYAGSDMFMMPSRFEPCGLGQMIALRYGTIPIVHRVGGLADTIRDYNPQRKTGNGFVFNDFSSFALLAAIVRGLESYKYRDRWEKLMRSGMRESYSWELPAKQYVKLYRFARTKRRLRSPVHWHPDKALLGKINPSR